MRLRRLFSISSFFPFIFFIQHLCLYLLSSFWIVNKPQFFYTLITFNARIFQSKSIELIFIAFPLVLHVLIGLYYMIKKSYFFPAHTHYTLRKANVLQRFTAWILLLGISLHVVQMRFINNPKKININNKNYFIIKVKKNEKIYEITKKLDIKILENGKLIGPTNQKIHISEDKNALILKNHTYAAATTTSKAFLIMIINNFQSKILVFLYTIFVMAASFHVFNGLWLFSNYWKIPKSHKTNRNILIACMVFVLIFTTMGLVPIWTNFLFFY